MNVVVNLFHGNMSNVSSQNRRRRKQTQINGHYYTIIEMNFKTISNTMVLDQCTFTSFLWGFAKLVVETAARKSVYVCVLEEMFHLILMSEHTIHAILKNNQTSRIWLTNYDKNMSYKLMLLPHWEREELEKQSLSSTFYIIEGSQAMCVSLKKCPI